MSEKNYIEEKSIQRLDGFWEPLKGDTIEGIFCEYRTINTQRILDIEANSGQTLNLKIGKESKKITLKEPTLIGISGRSLSNLGQHIGKEIMIEFEGKIKLSEGRTMKKFKFFYVEPDFNEE